MVATRNSRPRTAVLIRVNVKHKLILDAANETLPLLAVVFVSIDWASQNSAVGIKLRTPMSRKNHAAGEAVLTEITVLAIPPTRPTNPTTIPKYRAIIIGRFASARPPATAETPAASA